MTRAQRDLHLEALMSQISAIMKEQNITQAELARRSNMPPQVICRVLGLKVDPRASTLVAILSALNRQLDLKQENMAQ